jgi:hypothetical protein
MLSIKEIKSALDEGKKVVSESGVYEIKKDRIGQYLINCPSNGYCIGLHGMEGTEFEHVPNYTESDGFRIV